MYNDALIQRDRAQQALSDLRKKARHAYQITLEAFERPQNFIEPQLAIVKQSDSLPREATDPRSTPSRRQRELAKNVMPS